MKKMRCTSCGAELKVEDNKEYAVCEHCGSKYKMNEDLNINIKIDDNVKDVIKSGGKAFSKLLLIPVGIFVIGVICITVFSFTARADMNKKYEDSKQQIEEGKEAVESVIDEGKRDSFNFQFTSDAGTKNGIQVRGTLDDIIKSNKTNDRTVTLVYGGKSTTDETEIINIKHELGDWDDYEVVVNYGDDGYVNEIKVDKIG